MTHGVDPTRPGGSHSDTPTLLASTTPAELLLLLINVTCIIIIIIFDHDSRTLEDRIHSKCCLLPGAPTLTRDQPFNAEIGGPAHNHYKCKLNYYAGA